MKWLDKPRCELWLREHYSTKKPKRNSRRSYFEHLEDKLVNSYQERRFIFGFQAPEEEDIDKILVIGEDQLL